MERTIERKRWDDTDPKLREYVQNMMLPDLLGYAETSANYAYDATHYGQVHAGCDQMMAVVRELTSRLLGVMASSRAMEHERRHAEQGGE